MYAITGVTGNVGGELARTLLAQRLPVRAVVRDPRKAEAWAARGCEIALAALEDPVALAAAFAGAAAVFVLPPPIFDPRPGYPEARAVIKAVCAALAIARPDRVVCLSTVGADAPHDNLLSQRTLMEAALGRLDVPVTFLRPAWFIDNARWDLAAARAGLIHSFLQPLDRAIPMVAAADVGRVAAELLQHHAPGTIELEGPRRLSPNDLAAIFADLLGTPVRIEAVPRASWERLLRAQGMQHPDPRMRMLDGFNDGWIDFAGPPRVATTDARAVLAACLASERATTTSLTPD